MSEKEMKRRKIARAVMRYAWVMYRRCMICWKVALRISWRLVRFKALLRYSKIRGTTYSGRQDVLRRISKYPVQDIGLSLHREWDNPYDPNAIRIEVEVRNKGSAVVGYMSHVISNFLSPYIDSGGNVEAMMCDITGLNRRGALLGMNIQYVLF